MRRHGRRRPPHRGSSRRPGEPGRPARGAPPGAGPALRHQLPAAHQLAGLAQAGQSGNVGQLPDVEGVAHAAQLAHGLRRPDQIADAKPGQPVDLRERSQDGDVRPAADVLGNRVRVVRIVDILQIGLVDNDQHLLRHRVQEPLQGLPADHRAGGVVGGADIDQARPAADPGGQRVQVVSAAAERRVHRHAAHLACVQVVALKRRPAHRSLVARVKVGGGQVADQGVRAVPQRHLGRRHPELLSQPLDQLGRLLRIAVEPADLPLDRLQGGRERPVRALVGSQLDHPVQARLAAHLGGRLPRLVRRQIGDRRARLHGCN